MNFKKVDKKNCRKSIQLPRITGNTGDKKLHSGVNTK